MRFENKGVCTSCISNILRKVDHVMTYKKQDGSVCADLLDSLCACENLAYQKQTQASCQLCCKYEMKEHCAKQAEQINHLRDINLVAQYQEGNCGQTII